MHVLQAHLCSPTKSQCPSIRSIPPPGFEQILIYLEELTSRLDATQACSKATPVSHVSPKMQLFPPLDSLRLPVACNRICV